MLSVATDELGPSRKACPLKDLVESGGVERRSRTRYPLALGAKYQILGRERRTVGTGHTRDISSRGFYVETQDRRNMRVGIRLQTLIAWPTLLEGTIPLQLIVVGRVVRLDNSGFAIAMERHTFHTQTRAGRVPRVLRDIKSDVEVEVEERH